MQLLEYAATCCIVDLKFTERVNEINNLMGIIWMVRMICQFMNHGEYKGDAFIYSHKEVLDLIRDMADKLNVRNLLLYHTEDKNLEARKKLYCEEGSEYYHGNLFIPDDLEVLEL